MKIEEKELLEGQISYLKTDITILQDRVNKLEDGIREVTESEYMNSLVIKDNLRKLLEAMKGGDR